MANTIRFTEPTIQNIFGHEAAEDETFERLKQYYFKINVYEKITADLPLRILVGHKGIGKSALFMISIHEDQDRGRLPILIRPDDITGIGDDTRNFLQTIREWKHGLQKIIATKALNQFGVAHPGNLAAILSSAGKVINYLRDTIKPYADPKVSGQPTQQVLVKNFLKNSSITVYVDDLDRGWEEKKQDINRISALLNALRDLTNENEGLRFKVALRSDVYFLVRTSDESTDKVEGSVIWFAWTNHEILAMLAKRIETFFGREANERELLSMHQSKLASYLHPVMAPYFTGEGKWANAAIYRILMSLIRKRPRDLVKLCTLAARHAYDRDSNRIETEDFRAIFEEYSQGRVQDTINEFRSELPDIERLIMNMKPNRMERKAALGYRYKTDALLNKIKNIRELGRFYLANRDEADAKTLAHFLYKINFLTARKVLPSGEIDRKYFEENRYLSSKFADFGYDWEVHPAYRWALEPDNIADLYARLDLSADTR